MTDQNKGRELTRAIQLIDALRETGIRFHHFSVDYKNKTIQIKGREIPLINEQKDLDKWMKDYK